MPEETNELIRAICLIVPSLLTVIQIAPIKINPWSALLQWFGNEINKDIKADLKAIHQEIDTMRHESDENEARRLRANILDFANSCRNDRKHTKDEFENISRDYDDYMTIIKRRNLKNGFVEAEYDYILEVFHHCQMTNNFL